jgi:hypothetical protein
MHSSFLNSQAVSTVCTRARSAAIAGALALTTFLASPAAGQELDSLVAQLGSPVVRLRAAALIRMMSLGAPALRGAPANAIISLFEREALGLATGRETEPISPGDDTYSEYVIALTHVALMLRDPRTVRGLALLGIQTSLAAEEFVASQGSASLEPLNEAWARKPNSRSSIVETWTLMLARGVPITPAERGRVMARLLAPDDTFPDQLAHGAAMAGLITLAPLIHSFADSESFAIGRRFLLRDAARLDSVIAAMSPAAQLADLQSWVSGFCGPATGARQGACNALSADLDDAAKHIAGGRSTPAQNALSSAAKRATDAARQGAFSPLEARLVTTSANAVRARLGG